MSITKKITAISISLATVISLSGALMLTAPIVQAVTVEELQAQIADLLAQITKLQQQLTATQGTTTTTSATFTKDLTLGSKGDEVTALQELLISEDTGDAAAVLAEVGATGYFGKLTQAALAEYQKAAGITPSVGYFGPKTRAYVVSSGITIGITTTTGTTTGTTTTGTTAATSGLTLALASDNPASATLPKGAAGSVLLKFNVSGKGTLNSLVFKRMGIGATTDFESSGFYLYEGASRLTSGRSINSTTHEISFLNLALAVDGTKTLSVLADIATSSTAGDVSYLQLMSVTGDPTPTGALTGNSMTIGGATVGTITATSGAAPSNPKVGQTGALLAEFKLTASATEDVEISRIALTEGGSIANANVVNLVLKQGGNTLATAVSIGAKDLATFELASIFLLEKGQERTFQVYGDVAGATRTSDTIVFYFDSKSDIVAKGKTYGYPAFVSISGIDTTSEADTLTVAGGDVTITFNGPVTGDVAIRAQDAVLYDFTIASKNSIEIRNLRLAASTTGAAAVYNDFKVWDKGSNSVITSASNLTTASSTNVTFTDVININVGESKSFKVTADVDSSNSANGTITVKLLAFQSNDIKNLDNNTYVATASIVPSSTITGNAQTVKAPTIDVQLATTPTSQTYVQGLTNVALAGFSFRAISDDIKISSIKITGSSTSDSASALTTGDVQSLALYDGETKISDVKSLDSDLTITFDNLNYTLTKGTTKVFTLKGSISSNATDSDDYYFYIAGANSTYLTVYDKDGNSATISGTAANSGASIVHTITTTGTVAVAKASDDTESEAGIVLANSENVLAKFRFTATNEEMTINKMQLLVVPTGSRTATSSAASDEVPTVKLYEGSTQIGATAGYTVTGSGDNSGTVYIENLGWKVTKNGSKTLTVKGILNSISGGADTGASVYASVMDDGFEAQGATAKTTSLTGTTGNQKVVYKTKPTISLSGYNNTGKPANDTQLNTGQIPVIRFKIKADGPEQVAFKQIQFQVAMTGATMTAIDTAPGTNGTAKLRMGTIDINNVISWTDLNIASGFSGTATTTTGQSNITGGQTGYVSLLLDSEQNIKAGDERYYELQLTFSDVPNAVTSKASVGTKLYRSETTLVNASTVANIRSSLGTATDAAPSFVWSDYSNVSHTESTTDWANGVYVKTLPSDSVTINN